jgi:hypothetical protein
LSIIKEIVSKNFYAITFCKAFRVRQADVREPMEGIPSGEEVRVPLLWLGKF